MAYPKFADITINMLILDELCVRIHIVSTLLNITGIPIFWTEISEECSKWASKRENLPSGVCEQQRRRPACASAQTDQRLCYLLIEKYI